MTKKEIPWHFLELKEIKERLETDFERGLDEKEAERRLKKYGPNAFEQKRRFYYLKLLWKQVKSPLVFILFIAGVLTLFLKEYANTIVIFIAVFINTAMGIFQEGKASQAFEKLRSSQKKYATVIREGRKKIIEASELVPGDIIELQIGDQVPADCRLIEEKGLETNEAVLTGEWLATAKEIGALKQETQIAERTNMVWMSTLATEGWARAVVAGTGLNTEIGKIAQLLKEKDTITTPLQKEVRHLARILGLIAVFALIVLFILGIWQGKGIEEMFLVAVALAVSAIPEGLPAAVTVVLAIGMQKIFSKGGLIKNLNSAETLGSTSIILTDKTGTLTKAEMQISKIIALSENKLDILKMALLSSEAFIENPDNELKEWVIRGRPAEKAILHASIEAGLQPIELLKNSRRADFIPFDSERRYTASLYKQEKGSRVYVMGAPETIIGFCDPIGIKTYEYEKEASQGARVLATAFRDGNWEKFPHHGKDHIGDIFQKMTFGGFIVFHDPLRDDAKEYIKKSKEALIRPILVTGDYTATAKKIGEEIGILSENGLILTGEEIEKMDDKELQEIIGKVDVFARVLPHQKMRIARAWQERGEVVAMTGDGVNDAPALKHADIGVALGSATEVAKEASDLILLNNSFGIIVDAIEEGRRILDNLRKIIAYLLSTSFSEIILVAGSILIGAPLPILPAQILWINIIEEGFMNFAFAFEPAEENILKRDPKKERNRGILTKRIKRMILIMVAITSVLLVSLFFLLHFKGYPVEKMRSIMFAAVSIDAIFFSFSLKNLRKPIWKINLFSNMYLIFSLSLSVILLMAALFVPVLQKLLSVVPLSLQELMIILGIGIFNLLSIEIVKHFVFRPRRKGQEK